LAKSPTRALPLLVFGSVLLCTFRVLASIRAAVANVMVLGFRYADSRRESEVHRVGNDTFVRVDRVETPKRCSAPAILEKRIG
jgi:hypothetical protein